jgi:hypothetical protein
MRKKNQLLGYFLFGSTLCMGQVKHWAVDMQLFPLDSSKANRITIAVGAGVSTPSKSTGTKVTAVSLAELWVNAYLPFGPNKNIMNKRVSVGLYAGLGYGLGYGNGGVNNLQGINITGQRAAPVLAVKSSGGLQHKIISTAIGIQAKIRVSRFLFSPILSVGYLQLNQQKKEVEQFTVISNAGGKDTAIRFTMFAQQSAKGAGLSFLPGLRMGYAMGRLDFWAEGQYTSGPIVKRDEAVFVPQGPVKPTTGYYTLSQIQQGKLQYTQGRAAKYQSRSIRLGVSLKLPRYGGKPRKKCTCAG